MALVPRTVQRVSVASGLQSDVCARSYWHFDTTQHAEVLAASEWCTQSGEQCVHRHAARLLASTA